jgi:hypothetical protein
MMGNKQLGGASDLGRSAGRGRNWTGVNYETQKNAHLYWAGRDRRKVEGVTTRSSNQRRPSQYSSSNPQHSEGQFKYECTI